MRLKTVLVFFVMAACSYDVPNSVVVHASGSLRSLIYEGDLTGKVALDSLAITGNYGIGALDSLGGEIWLEDGRIWISKVENGSPKVIQEPGEMAALMVYSSIDNWESFETSGNIEEIVPHKARQAELKSPFPFIIKGKFPGLKYHIVQFEMGEDDLAKHQQHAYHSSLSNETVTILGFYSERHQGIFTHQGSNFHMHVRDDSFKTMGHLEEIQTGNHSYTLMLPVP